MATASHLEPSSDGSPVDLSVLESQVRESFGRVVFSHKTHEKDADRYFRRLNFLKMVQIVLSTVTTGGLVVILLGASRVATVVATLTSSLLLALTFYTKDYDLGELAQKHSDTAVRLWTIRESYQSLLADIATGDVSLGHVRNRRAELQEDLESVYRAAPRTTPKAYKAAQKALQVEQELTFDPGEIDNFLPPALRKMQPVHRDT